jgi:uncharacterized coiled-coil protein SlyX
MPQGLTPRETARIGAPLSPTELILLENALTIAEQRITELEAALDETKTEDGRQKAHIAKLYSSIDGLKTELTEERLKKFAPSLPSEMCVKHHVQNCHCCDNLDCGDNTSEAKKRIAELEAESTKLKEENILARCHIRGMKERISELEAANKKITELADKVTLENLTLYGKIRVLTARIAELEAANQWHDASEPPENIIEKKLLLMEINSTTKRRYWRIGRWLSRNESLGTCIGWRDLPPTLGKE